MIICALLQEKTGPERMRWAPQSHSQQAAPREQRSAPAGGGSTAASEWQPCRCAKRCGESPWWCACAPPGQGSPSWPSWPLKSSTPPSHSPGLPPPGTASSSPSITSATCARTQRDRHPDRDSGEATPTCNQRVTNNATLLYIRSVHMQKPSITGKRALNWLSAGADNSAWKGWHQTEHQNDEKYKTRRQRVPSGQLTTWLTDEEKCN